MLVELCVKRWLKSMRYPARFIPYKLQRAGCYHASNDVADVLLMGFDGFGQFELDQGAL